ncbi:MAG: oligosaccharide flippase family protein [Planctomycetes bacterium]|nr:oligosaccharide flippase family protein [Planctomycetota bacterium]
MEQSGEQDHPEAQAAPANSPPTALYTARGVSFALLANPTVQAIRFASKLALPWLVTTAEFGEATLAGVIMFGVQHLAVFGFDEALISAPNIDAPLYARARRLQTIIGVLLALCVAGAGLAMQWWPDQARLGMLLIALSPMTVVANLGTLPTAILVRDRCFARIFAVDLVMITSLTVVSIGTAALGAGEWSLVYAWHANAIASLVAASIFARPLLPKHVGGAVSLASVRHNGAHFTGAALLGYLGERLDSASVGFGLGRAALGLFELAQTQSQVMINYATSVSERLLFPTFALQYRAGGLQTAYMQALRITLMFVLPLHVLLALTAEPIVNTFFPTEWGSAAPLLSCLAMAAGARCFDLTAITAIKASAHGKIVFRLGILRIVLLGIALGFSLPHGVGAVAGAVLASRVIAALASLTVAWRTLSLSSTTDGPDLGAAGAAFTLWALAFAPAAWYLEYLLEGASVPLLAIIPLIALVVWLVARALLDRPALSRELARVRSGLE